MYIYIYVYKYLYVCIYMYIYKERDIKESASNNIKNFRSYLGELLHLCSYTTCFKMCNFI